MSNYLNVESVSEVMSAASRLRSRGDTLGTEMHAALAAVSALDTEATFPRDEFTENFLKEYHREVPGGDGLRFNEAVDESAAYLGEVARRMGERASTTMTAYAVTDDENAGDINGAAGM